MNMTYFYIGVFSILFIIFVKIWNDYSMPDQSLFKLLISEIPLILLIFGILIIYYYLGIYPCNAIYRDLINIVLNQHMDFLYYEYLPIIKDKCLLCQMLRENMVISEATSRGYVPINSKFYPIEYSLRFQKLILEIGAKYEGEELLEYCTDFNSQHLENIKNDYLKNASALKKISKRIWGS